MSEQVAPAETYTLNTLASVLGRYAVPDLSEESERQIGEMLDATIGELVDGDTPFVPHTRTELLEEAAKFDEKLLMQLRDGPAQAFVTTSQYEVVKKILTQHKMRCASAIQGGASWQMLTTPKAIAIAYGLPELWDKPEDVISGEVGQWGKSTAHPPVPDLLREKISIDETRLLMSLMWRRVIGTVAEPEVHTYLTDDTRNYHVYWSPLSERLDYATPATYDRATQLSFDLPHNATHLVHLEAMPGVNGAARYDDSMALRAYFEAVTVFSEFKAIQVAEQDDDFRYELENILGVRPDDKAGIDIAGWVAQDRRYEFKLRGARYAADILMTSGVCFRDSIAEISSTFGIPVTDAEKETRKYLAWPGLGAVYTFGYRKLLDAGVETVIEAIRKPSCSAYTSWPDFLNRTQS